MRVAFTIEGSKAEALAEVNEKLQGAYVPDSADVGRAIKDVVAVRLAGANDSDPVAVTVVLEIAADVKIPVAPAEARPAEAPLADPPAAE